MDYRSLGCGQRTINASTGGSSVTLLIWAAMGGNLPSLKVDYPASIGSNELRVALTYTLWITDGASRLRGVIKQRSVA
jgi:hypothetical protein